MPDGSLGASGVAALMASTACFAFWGSPGVGMPSGSALAAAGATFPTACSAFFRSPCSFFGVCKATRLRVKRKYLNTFSAQLSLLALTPAALHIRGQPRSFVQCLRGSMVARSTDAFRRPCGASACRWCSRSRSRPRRVLKTCFLFFFVF